MPNAGKSTLFNALTAAGAETGDYPFTTVEPNVAVPDDVVAALDSKGSPVPGGRVAASVDQFVPGDHLGADEGPLDVGVDAARGLVGGAAARQGTGHRLLAGVRGEEADQVEQLEGRADQALEAGALDAELVSHLLRLIGIELAQLGLHPG